MNELEGFKNWGEVIVPKSVFERKIRSIALSKPCFREMDDLGFRGIFRVNDFRRGCKSNAEVLKSLVEKLPTKIKLVAGFTRNGEERFSSLQVMLLGFTRDAQNNLIIKIDSQSRVNKR